MKITVKENRKLIIINPQNTQNEHIVETIELTVPTKYESWIKKIVFITPQNVVSRYFENNQYTIERDILQFNTVKFYIWLTNDEQDFRTETKQLIFYSNQSVTGEVTPAEKTEMERVIEELDAEITKTENLNIDVEKVGNTTIITLTDKDGNEKTVTILDGQDGLNGKDGVDGKDGKDGQDGAKGEKGEPGQPGEPGANGQDGKDGQDGQAGYTPQRGTDYWTASDIATIEAYCDTYIDNKVGSLSSVVNSIEEVVG